MCPTLAALHPPGGAPGRVQALQGLLRHAAEVQLRDTHLLPGAVADVQGTEAGAGTSHVAQCILATVTCGDFYLVDWILPAPSLHLIHDRLC